MKGQGTVEYALILILIVTVIIAVLALVGPGIGNLIGSNPCWDEDSFTCKNHRVQECLASELYTKEQCVTLIGGGA
jgi:hypothetical protein